MLIEHRKEAAKMQKYGYIRVSSKDQNLERQIRALQECQIPRENMYLDKLSGKDFERSAYRRLLKN
jgi:DNA invertase Pin-like site-specific DNA recombinase